MIHPYVSYGLMLWGSAYKSNLHVIEILQKKAIRNVHKAKYNDHTIPLFHSSKILKLDDMYKLQLLMSMFSYYRNMLPSPLCSLFIRNCDIHEHYTRCRNDPRAVARKILFLRDLSYQEHFPKILRKENLFHRSRDK